MIRRIIWRTVLITGIAAVASLHLASVVSADTTDTTTYGGGNYGACDYGSCSITLTSGGSTILDVLPTSAGKCSVQSDTASVLTNSDTGYNLTTTTSTTNNALVGSSANINASGATAASPTTLSMNTWGYRVDGLSGFGSGPTSAVSSGSVPSLTFAGIPASNQTPAPVASSSAPANPAATTKIWYGLCVNASIPAGAYTTTVVYTAVTN
jgi:hypothetical protein